MVCDYGHTKTALSSSVAVDINPETPPSNSSYSSPPYSSPAAAVVSPCAACKILRRRCGEGCVLAPYFPPSQPHKFSIAHRVFGASNIIKTLQELPESRRADAVSSMVYEATARIRDPIYGTAGAICHLQKQISELKAELARAQAEILTIQAQHANFLALIYMEIAQSSSEASPQPETAMVQQFQLQTPVSSYIDTSCFLDDTSLASPGSHFGLDEHAPRKKFCDGLVSKSTDRVKDCFFFGG